MKYLCAIVLLLLTCPVQAADESVLLHLLDTETKNPSAEPRFWIDWNEKWMAIAKSKTIQGDDAKEIVALLGKMLKNTAATHFCGHHPVYGIVSRRADGKILKTSLCFDCLTWVKPKKRLDIAGVTGINNPLCLVLRKHIELPAEMLKKAQEKKK